MTYQDDSFLYDIVMDASGAAQHGQTTRGFRHISELKYDDITLRAKWHLEACGYEKIFREEIDSLGNNILQSPLERSVICFLRTENYANQMAISDIAIELPGEESNFLNGRSKGVVITPQKSVGPYNLDFGLAVKAGTTLFHVDVECDGHEYHAASSAGINHDHIRDIFVAKKGYAVIRLAGYEINRNPLAAAQRVTENVGSVVRHFLEGHEL